MAEEAPAADKAAEVPIADEEAVGAPGAAAEGEAAEALAEVLEEEEEAEPPEPPDPNAELWAARDALPVEHSKGGRESREELWAALGASLVESMSVAELGEGLQGEHGLGCSAESFDAASAVQRGYKLARSVNPQGLPDGFMFPEFRLVLLHLKATLDVLPPFLAARDFPASMPPLPPPPEAAQAQAREGEVSGEGRGEEAQEGAAREEREEEEGEVEQEAVAEEGVEAQEDEEGEEEKAEEEEEQQLDEEAAAVKKKAKAAVVAMAAALAEKAARLSAPMPARMDFEVFEEACARLQEHGTVVSDVGVLWEELSKADNDSDEEISKEVELVVLVEWAACRAISGADLSEVHDPADDLTLGGALPDAEAVVRFLASMHAVRRTGKGLYGPNKPATALIECLRATEVDLELFEVLIAQKGVDKAARDVEFGWTPLHYAANMGSVEMVSLLLQARVRKEASCNNKNTALHLAARGNHAPVVKFLCSKAAPLNAKNGNGWTPLTWAAARGLAEVVSALLEAKADVGVADADGKTEAMWAARHGHTDIVKMLLEHGGLDLDMRDKDGLTLADHAQDYIEIRRELLEAEAANRGLLEAVQRNDADTVRRALEDGANVNSKDSSGWTALTWSMMHRSVDLVRLLAQYNADPGVLTASAEVLSDLDLGGPGLKEELEATLFASLESQSRLLAAAREGCWEAVGKELDDGAPVNCREDITLLSCLMFAALQCDQFAVSMLAARSADLDLADSAGWTALHFSVQAGDVETVALLHYLGADTTAETHEGKNAQHLAARADDAAMVQVLTAAGVDFNEEDSFEDQPAQVAARWGSADALSALLAVGASEKAEDRSGRSLLSLAALHGHAAVAEALLGFPQLPCKEEVLLREGEHLALLRQASEQRALLGQRFDLAAAERAAAAEAAEEEGEGEEDGGSDSALPSSSSKGKVRRSSRAGSGSAKSGSAERRASKTGGAGGERRASKTGGTGERRASSGRRGSKPGGAGGERKGSKSRPEKDMAAKVRRPSAGSKAMAAKGKNKDGQGRGRGRRKDTKIPAAWGSAQLGGEDGANDPLILAIVHRHRDVARVLLDYEAPLESADSDGNTPLLLATSLGQRTLVEDLLLAGASREAENDFGARALHLASHPGIRQLLLACAAEDLVAEAIKRAGAQTPADGPPPGKRTVYRIRLDGLPLLVLAEDVQEVVDGLLRRVLHNAVLPLRVTVATDPITLRPQGYAYADFLEEDSATELVRRKRKSRLGPRRVNLINEGARLEPWEEDEN